MEAWEQGILGLSSTFSPAFRLWAPDMAALAELLLCLLCPAFSFCLLRQPSEEDRWCDQLGN